MQSLNWAVIVAIGFCIVAAAVFAYAVTDGRPQFDWSKVKTVYLRKDGEWVKILERPVKILEMPKSESSNVKTKEG